jgi:hypothetical protein
MTPETPAAREQFAWVEDEFGDWLNQCGSCDVGLPMDCTCPPGDPRAVILALVERLDDVVTLHRQTSEVGLADGAWCPADGDPYPCRTLRAALGDQP